MTIVGNETADGLPKAEAEEAIDMNDDNRLMITMVDITRGP